jgi:hypothetical protein
VTSFAVNIVAFTLIQLMNTKGFPSNKTRLLFDSLYSFREKTLMEPLVRLRALLFRCLNLYFGSRYISTPYKNSYVHNRIPLPNNRSTLLVVHLFRVTGVRAILFRVPGFWRGLGFVRINLQLSHQEMRRWWFGRWGARTILKTLGSGCLLLEIRWQKGRQADRICTYRHSLPTFELLHLIFSPCPLGNLLKNISIHGKHLS